MKLNELKFQSRGDLLEAAELIGMSPEDKIPPRFYKLALLTGYAKSFAPNLNWSNIFQKNVDNLRNNPDVSFISILYTTREPIVCIPGLPILDEEGNVVKSDSAILESRTLHIDSILRNLYGQSIQTENTEETGTLHDQSDSDCH